MKKQSLIVIILCVLVVAVITLSVMGVIGQQESSPGSFAGYVKDIPTVSPLNTLPNVGTPWDHSYETET